MVLYPVQGFRRQCLRVQSFVHVAVEGQHGLARVLGGELGRPGGVTGHVELRQRVAQVHQLGDLLRGVAAQHLDEFSRLPGVQGLAVGQVLGDRAVVVQGLGGREEKQHGRIMRMAQDVLGRAADRNAQ